MLRQPAAADEAIQIVLRTNAAVETREIEAGFERRRRGDTGAAAVAARLGRAWPAHAASTAARRQDDESF